MELALSGAGLRRDPLGRVAGVDRGRRLVRDGRSRRAGPGRCPRRHAPWFGCASSAVSVDARAGAGPCSRVRLHRALAGSGWCPAADAAGRICRLRAGRAGPGRCRRRRGGGWSRSSRSPRCAQGRPLGSMPLPSPARTWVDVLMRVLRRRVRGQGWPSGSIPLPSPARRCVIVFIGILPLRAASAVGVDAGALSGANAGLRAHVPLLWVDGRQLKAGGLIPNSAIDCAFTRHRPLVILSATTLYPRRAPTAAARRIYTIGCATAGGFAQTGYRSFGLQPLAHAAMSAWSASG